MHRALLVNNAAVTYGKDKYPQHPHKHTHTHSLKSCNVVLTSTGVWKMCLENQENQSTGLPVTLLQTCFFGLRVEALFDSALTGRTMAEIGESVVTLRPTK